jgi:hypothetical protein
MPGTTALQLYSYPLTTDQAAPSGIQTLAQSIEKQVVAVFPDAATRDSRWAAATGLTNGAVCFLTSTGELQLRAGGAWVVIGGRATAFAMAAGTVTLSYSAAATASAATTYPTGRFSAPPLTVVTAHTSAGGVGNAYLSYQVTANTATGFTLLGLAQQAITASIASIWNSTQMTSAASAG